jgi:hypothetical protein
VPLDIFSKKHAPGISAKIQGTLDFYLMSKPQRLLKPMLVERLKPINKVDFIDKFQ